MTFDQNIGLILFRLSKRVEGSLCPACTDSAYWGTSLITVALGWWGLISFFVTPVILIGNLVRYVGALKGFARVLPRRDVLGSASAGWGVITLPGLGFCGLASVPGLIAALVGFFDAGRSGASRKPALLGAAVNGLSLIATVGLGLLAFGMAASIDADASLGEAMFRAADGKILSYRGEEGFGNTPQAQEIASRFSRIMGPMSRIAFEGGRDSHEGTLTEGHFLTWVELRAESICFLVHVPELRAYRGEVRESLLDLAWTAAKTSSSGVHGDRPVDLAVGLRGVMLYGAIAIGPASAEEPVTKDFTGSASTEPLHAFFEGPALEAGALEATADASPAPSPARPLTPVPATRMASLQDALSASDENVRARAAGELGSLAERGYDVAPALPTVREALGDPSPRIRAAMLPVIARAERRLAVPRLSVFLSDPDPEVRTAAATALHFLEAEAATATPMLIRLATGPDRAGETDTDRARATEALVRFPASPEIDTALTRLAADPDPLVRGIAQQALRTRGASDAGA